ncbi:MAG: YtxH domain-containing protein [Gemmatimonadota bacterium]|nr:YtxH domain-containing protein [Gemmatimonadota bacterium]
MRNHEHDEPYIVIEKHSDASSLLIGVLIGASVALLFAPRSGEETRGDIRRKVRQAGDVVKSVAEEVTGQVADTYEGAKARVEEQIDTVRDAVVTRKRQVSRAINAGREAALQAREELETQLAETKAAYSAGAGVARSGRVKTAPPLANDKATV